PARERLVTRRPHPARVSTHPGVPTSTAVLTLSHGTLAPRRALAVGGQVPDAADLAPDRPADGPAVAMAEDEPGVVDRDDHVALVDPPVVARAVVDSVIHVGPTYAVTPHVVEHMA